MVKMIVEVPHIRHQRKVCRFAGFSFVSFFLKHAWVNHSVGCVRNQG